MLEGQEVRLMRIVVWKAPRVLRGLLRCIFGMNA